MRTLRVAGIVTAAMLSMSLLTACPSNPVREAESVDEQAYALYGTFVVYEELAAKVVVDPATPAEVKRAIKEADAKAKPVMDDLLSLARKYIEIRNQLGTAPDSDGRLKVATDNLARWILESEPLVRNLVKSVQGK